MKKNQIILLVIIPIILLTTIIVCFKLFENKLPNSTPILKVEIKVPDWGILQGDIHYYNVYENEKYEETQEFSFSDEKAYPLGTIQEQIRNDEDVESEDIPKYAVDIVNQIEKIGNSYAGSLYVIKERYFFSVTDNRTVQNEYVGALFEYLPKEDKVKKIIGFENGYIQHVMPYE